MKSFHLFAATLVVAWSVSAQAATIGLTLNNTTFDADAHDSDPAGWLTQDTEVGTVEGAIHVWANVDNPSDPVLAFQGRPNSPYLQQSLSTSEATAETYGSFTIGFESGWRNNSSAPNSLSLRVSIWNVTDDAELGFAVYTFPPNTPSNLANTYRVLGDQELSITYDNAAAGIVGDTIALRFTTVSSQNNFNPTGWIDNISVSAVVSEVIPSPAALPAGLAMIAAVAGRRRRR